VAYCAGFASIRRFNDAFRAAYKRSPSEWRRTKAKSNGSPDVSSIHLKLSYRAPFDWLSLIRFLGARAIPGVESVSELAYQRTVSTSEGAGVIEVRPLAGERHLLLTVPSELSRGLAGIAEGVRRLFDLKADPGEIASHLANDAKLSAAVKAHPGIRVPGAWNGFEIGVRAILGQQVSVAAATTLSGRIATTFGEPFADATRNGLSRLFPAPERLAEANVAGVGLPSKRAETIRHFASAIATGELRLTTSASLDETIEALTALPGIGPWTANYIAMRALGEPDAFPSSDLVLRRAAAGKSGVTLSEAQLLDQAEAWRPWRAYAAVYLWTSYAGQKRAGEKA
jgi:AraC family transcriptional regulator of adaptative response / DNA-3-methyladenine glycosylase II